jgi:hypothetical protein
MGPVNPLVWKALMKGVRHGNFWASHYRCLLLFSTKTHAYGFMKRGPRLTFGVYHEILNLKVDFLRIAIDFPDTMKPIERISRYVKRRPDTTYPVSISLNLKVR